MSARTYRWIEAVAGLWIIVSPWLLQFSTVTVMKWSNVIVGTYIFLYAVWALFDTEEFKNENGK